MKRQIQKVGKRKWFGDDFLQLQDELYAAVEGMLLPYGDFIVSGCEVDGLNISSGIVYIDGKICRFDGATVSAFPVYLELSSTENQNRVYEDGNSKPTINEYKAILSETIPSGAYIEILSTGGIKFTDAIQDNNHLFSTSAEKESWNNKLASTSYTATDIIAKLLTVDGHGSNLDADLLDGNEASAFALKTGATFTGEIVGTTIKAKHKRTIQSIATAATFTHNCDSFDSGKITALTSSLIMAAPTGTPYDMQEFVMYVYSAISRGISWNAAFSGVMAGLPATTTAAKQMVFFFSYNTATSKWELMNTAIGV